MKNGNGKHSNRHSSGNDRDRDNNGRFSSDDDSSSRNSSDNRNSRNSDSDQGLMDWDQNDRRNNSSQDQDDYRRNNDRRSDNDYDENSGRNRRNSNRGNDDRDSNTDGGSYGNYSSGGYNSGSGSFSGSNYSSAGFGGGNYGVGNYGSGSYGSGSSGIGNVSNYGSGGTRGMDYPAQENDWSNTEESSGSGNRTSHRGKGPKGYKRSDERIQEDINDKLSDDHQLDASNIEVKVESGEVTLSGTVSDRRDKRRAEDLVESISGVSNVQNSIRVSKGDSSSNSGGTTEKHKTNGKH